MKRPCIAAKGTAQKWNLAQRVEDFISLVIPSRMHVRLTAWPSLPCTVTHRLTMCVLSAQTGSVLLLCTNTPGSKTWSYVNVTVLKAHITHVHWAVPDMQLVTAAAGQPGDFHWQRAKGWWVTQGMCTTQATWPGRWRGRASGLGRISDAAGRCARTPGRQARHAWLPWAGGVKKTPFVWPGSPRTGTAGGPTCRQACSKAG